MNNERRKRRLRPWMVVLLLLAGLLAYMYWPAGPVKIIISRETTYIDGPLNPDGTPNYVAYLNQKCSDGVTPENNAAPLLLRAFGPDMLPDKVRAETLSILSLPADLLDRDKHFVMWQDRTRPAKAGTTMPAQPDANNAPTDEDDDSGPSTKELRDMLLAGKVHPELEPWLAENAAALELLRQAADKKKLYLPLVSTSTPPSMVDVTIPGLRNLTKSVESLTLRALLKANRNDLAGAWDDVLLAHKLARLMGQSPTLIGRLVASGMEGYAAKAGIDLATRYPWPAGLARTVLGRLVTLEPSGDMVDSIDECERFFSLDAVMMLARGGSLRDFVGNPTQGGSNTSPFNAALNLDWNQMLRKMNSWYDGMAKPLRIPWCQGRRQANEAFNDEVKKTARGVGNVKGGLKLLFLRFGGRPCRGAFTSVVTDLLVAILIPSLGQAATLDDRTKANSEIEIVAAALAGHHAETGRWPAELKELCPSLLKTIPIDRFSGKPLIYKPSEKGYLLYSVNDNLRDDGGQMDPHSRGDEKKDDIAAEVKPAETQPAETKPAASQP